MATRENRIRDERQAAEKTLAVLADEAGVSVRSLISYEQGYRSPSLKTLGKIAEALNVSPRSLVADDGVDGGPLGSVDMTVDLKAA